MALSQFSKDYKKLSRDSKLKVQMRKVLERLQTDPFQLPLKTHKVDVPSLGSIYSSKVTGDLRLLWVFDQEDNLVIIAIRLQGHDTVYK